MTCCLLWAVVSFSQNVVKDSVYVVPNGVANHSEINQKLPSTQSSDSIVQKYLKSIASLQVLENPLEQGDLNLDSIKKRFRPVRGLHGQASIGHEFGLLTGYIDPEATSPIQVFNTLGDFGMQALGVPINLSYRYSTFRNPMGINNYFRISVDTEAMRNKVEEKKGQTLGKLTDASKKVDQGKAELSGKLGMGEVLMQKYKREASNYERKMQGYDKELQSISVDTTQLMLGDSSSIQAAAKRDSLQRKYTEAKARYDKARSVYDTLQGVYSKVTNLYNTYNQWDAQIKERKDQLSGLSSLNSMDGLKSKASDQVSERKNGFLGGLKTLDFGLTYPKTTGMSTNSVPIQGLNLELQQGKWYTAISAGIMMNNLMMSTDAVYNKFFNSENLFNQFDFQNVRDRGFLTLVRFGYGEVEQTHAHIGFRYLSNSISAVVSDPTTAAILPSLGMELDLRYIPKKSPGTAVDFVYGKTSRYETVENGGSVFSSLFSTDRTHTTLFRVSQQIAKIRSRVSASARWIDPFADVRSYGVMQPDNARIELRSDHAVSKFFEFGMNYRMDRGNVALLTDTTHSINMVGVHFNGTVIESIQYFGSFNYLMQNQRIPASVSRTNNYMISAGVSGSYKLFDLKHSATLAYSDYQITDAFSTGVFRSLTIQHATKLRKGQNTFTLGYFSVDDPNLLASESLIIGDELSWQFRKVKLLGGLKIAQSGQYGTSWGGKLELAYRMWPFAELQLRAEKLVLGDFYNYYNRQLFDNFPFAFTSRIHFYIK